MGKLAVEGKKRHEHLEFGDEADRFERQPTLGNLPPRTSGGQLAPKPLSLTFFGINQAGDPLLAPATRARFDDVQSVLQHATLGGLPAAELKWNALLDEKR